MFLALYRNTAVADIED